jgi:transcriptional regulator with XRE-family HTH domain
VTEKTLASLDPKQLGQRLKKARLNAGLSVGQASIHSGLAREVLTAFESATQKIEEAQLVQLSLLYGCQFTDFFEEPVSFASHYGAYRALMRGEITEAQWMRWLKIDRGAQR